MNEEVERGRRHVGDTWGFIKKQREMEY